ncbi:amidophosphoribosyltransferase [Flavobacterium ammoniigenes]|jgi:ComF family protein|uniref:Amidophosphoribosyltransferase n=2 Tax=Flavobacterium ammoniigenes TaxID=1751095 RepID=A0ABM7V3M3_9FLAO|nr:phosphoribosyltransferase family protein [Flavobacterium ammoniigenes]BDB54124.1 amidophosphoribosyltransferase [Flavobacterium ammoniigenes]
MSNENVICTKCRHEIPLTQHHKNPENDAYKKFYGRIPVEQVSALVYFHKKGIVQELIHSLKYRGQEAIGTVLGEWYGEELKSSQLLQTVDAIIPVPLHPKKLRERGYNQVTEFGNALAKKLEIPVNNSILYRQVYSKTQSQKNRLGRTEGIDTIFDVSFDEKDHNKHFLLIDDVITTGATLEVCAKALLKIPGTKISIVCMAMADS